ncbi:MAG: hypothetical protein ABW021_03080 [Acidimicrobiia bacterium]
MIWLQSPPWARWAVALLIASGALWIEFRPEPTTPHPFAAEDVTAGSVVDESNTEIRQVPTGTFSEVELGQVALDSILAGDPVLASNIGESGQAVPKGWWSLEMPLPRGAHRGDSARIVLLDSEVVASGVVVEDPDEDPLGSGLGLVAVESRLAAEVARAAGEGRAVVMIAPP